MRHGLTWMCVIKEVRVFPTEPQLTESPARTRTLRCLLALAIVALILLGSLLYLNYRMLAQEVIVGWLRTRGVDSEIQVESVGVSGLVARLRAGDATAPDFTVARAQVGYRLRGLGFEVTSVRLSQPILRARLQGGQLKVGALDRLVREFLDRPPQPDAANPRIEVEDGVLLLATDYGAMRISADAMVANGKLMKLVAASDPMRLRVANFDVDLGRSVLDMTTQGDEVKVHLEASITAMSGGALSAGGARLQVVATTSYPDLANKEADGAIKVRADLTGRRLALGGQAFAAPRLSASFTGQVSGWVDDLTLAGRLTARMAASSGVLGSARSGVLQASAVTEDLRWTRSGGDRLIADFRLSGNLDALASGDLRLREVSAEFSGPLTAERGDLALSLAGAVTGRGAWRGLGPAEARDSTDIAALKAAVRGFRIAASGVSIHLRGGTAEFGLPRTLDLTSAAGGLVRIRTNGGAPLLGSGSAVQVSVRGGGLPRVTAELRRLRFDANGLAARANLNAQLSIGAMEHGDVGAEGRIQLSARGLTFFGSDCAQVSVKRLEFGIRDVEDLAGRLCPTAEPMLQFGGGGWRIAGQAEAFSAFAPFLQARVDAASGPAAFLAPRMVNWTP